ncbi:MAG TPA: TraR/DksA C4-type zinc finger protein [Acidimicrobiales bacterium]|nr:TraR/DksA C4-type zinc finger protein [Acidimicrobiales bacterium]
MATTDQHQQLRSALEEERDQLVTQLEEHGVDSAGMEFDENFADSGQVAAEQGENRALLNQLADTLIDVKHALTKLDDGGYGACEHCGEMISKARLEAMPASRYCITCAQRR